MGNSIKKGIYMIFLSIAIIGALGIDYGIGDVAMIFRMIITPTYLLVWFLEGSSVGNGFLKGLVQGTVGSLFGIIVSIWTTIYIQNGQDPVAVLKMTAPWLNPLLGIVKMLDEQAFYNIHPLLIQYLSVILIILVTASGSLFGKLYKEYKAKKVK